MEDSTTAKSDRFLRGSFFMFGYCVLTPWASLLSSTDYFENIYENYNIMRWISVTYLVTATVTLLISGLVPVTDNGFRRISTAICIYFLAMVSIPIVDIAVIGDNEGANLTFLIQLLICCAIGLAAGLLEGITLSLAFHFPPRCFQAYMSGVGFAALINVGIRALLKVGLSESDDGDQISGRIFFIYAAAVCFFTLVILKTIIGSKLNNAVQYQSAPVPQVEDGLGEENPQSVGQKRDLFGVLSLLKKELLLLVCIYAITLTLYPGVPSDVESGTLGSWYSVMLVGIFSIFDFVSRVLPESFFVTSPRVIIISILARSLFIPIGILIVQYYSNPVTISLFMSALAASNGYFTICSIGLAHTTLQVSDQKSLGSSLLNAAILLGLSIGSVLSIAWSAVF